MRADAPGPGQVLLLAAAEKSMVADPRAAMERVREKEILRVECLETSRIAVCFSGNDAHRAIDRAAIALVLVRRLNVQDNGK